VFVQKRAFAVISLGWKKFKGDDGLAGGFFFSQDIADQFHGRGLCTDWFAGKNKKPLPAKPEGAKGSKSD
jgi:hypothetical protein